MAVVNMDFESQLYGGRHMISMILPDLPRDQEPEAFYVNNKKFKVLWLLHGTFGDHTDWIRRTNIEVYACEKNLAVVMPAGMNSDYVNWKGFGVGFNMYDYLFEELMPMIYHWYPISDKREDNFIAGLSMGGMGALSYALTRPEKFAAAGSLSAPLFHYREMIAKGEIFDTETPAHLKNYRPSRWKNQIENAGGEEEFLQSPMNAWDRLAENYKNSVNMPKLYFCSGTADFLYPYYQKFKKYAQESGWNDIVFEEEEGLGHEWRFWDKYIERFLTLYVSDSKKKLGF